MSREHFTVDGTLVEAWASVKSFRKKDEKKRPPPDDPKNPTVDFRGEKRGNASRRRIRKRCWRAAAIFNTLLGRGSLGVRPMSSCGCPRVELRRSTA